jgi:uncharacterized protein YukE
MESKGDTTLVDLISVFKKQAQEHELSSDQTVELVINFVQSIPYDEEKRATMLAALNFQSDDGEVPINPVIASSLPRFPYETLYDNKGICTDKTFLAVALLEKLGYGTALFNFEKHVAPGIRCPLEYSSFDSGYCYTEVSTTGFFIGELPSSVEKLGQAIKKSAYEMSKELWDIGQDELISQEVRVYEVVEGRSYQRIVERAPTLVLMRDLEDKFDRLNKTVQQIEQELKQLESIVKDYQYQAEIVYQEYLAGEGSDLYYTYNDLVKQYESVQQQYEAKSNEYEEALIQINSLISEYSVLLKELNTV